MLKRKSIVVKNRKTLLENLNRCSWRHTFGQQTRCHDDDDVTLRWLFNTSTFVACFVKGHPIPLPGLHLPPNPLHPILSSCSRPPTKLQGGNVFSRVCLFRRGISDTPSVQGPSARPRPHSRSDMFKIFHYEARFVGKWAGWYSTVMPSCFKDSVFTGRDCTELLTFIHRVMEEFLQVQPQLLRWAIITHLILSFNSRHFLLFVCLFIPLFGSKYLMPFVSSSSGSRASGEAQRLVSVPSNTQRRKQSSLPPPRQKDKQLQSRCMISATANYASLAGLDSMGLISLTRLGWLPWPDWVDFFDSTGLISPPHLFPSKCLRWCCFTTDVIDYVWIPPHADS